MPQGIPQAYKPPADGIHTLLVLGVETKIDGFGKPQEVATCEVDGVEGQSMRLYFPHNSKKAFDQGVSAGLIAVDDDNWEVVPGKQCRALIQGGKTVQIFAL